MNFDQWLQERGLNQAATATAIAATSATPMGKKRRPGAKDGYFLLRIDQMLDMGEVTLVTLQEILDRPDVRTPGQFLKAAAAIVAARKRQERAAWLEKNRQENLAMDAVERASEKTRAARVLEWLATTSNSELERVGRTIAQWPLVAVSGAAQAKILAALRRRQLSTYRFAASVIAIARGRLK